MNAGISPKAASIGIARRSFPLIGAFIFFIALWLLDFPKPFVDDLFYTGAGINLAGGGDLSNPLLDRQHFPSHYFFVYPPVHSFALAGFLKIFGVSALSLTGFQILMYFVSTVATVVLLRKHGAPPWLEWLVPLGVSASFLFIGLRPEPLSVALTMTGFALIECGCRRFLPVSAAFLLMFLGGACAPRLTLFAGALVLAAMWRLWDGSTADGWRRWSFCLPAFCALVVTVSLFLWMIGFRLEEFLETFRFHAHRLSDHSRIQLFWNNYFKVILGAAQWPLYGASIISLSLTFFHPRDALFRINCLLFLAFLLMLVNKSFGIGVTWYFVLMLFFSTVCFLNYNRKEHPMVLIAIGCILLLANCRILLNIAGILSGRIKNDSGDQVTMATQMSSTLEHRVVVDAPMARYVFDYKIPPHFLDFGFSAPFPGTEFYDYFQPQDTYIVGPEGVAELNKMTRLNFQAALPKWRPLGGERWFYYRYPRTGYVIPAETCKGLKQPE